MINIQKHEDKELSLKVLKTDRQKYGLIDVQSVMDYTVRWYIGIWYVFAVARSVL